MSSVACVLFAVLLVICGAVAQQSQGFFPGQGSSSDDYDLVTVPLSDLDASGCPVTTGVGGVRIDCRVHKPAQCTSLQSFITGRAADTPQRAQHISTARSKLHGLA
jgi:hypothetical protein